MARLPIYGALYWKTRTSGDGTMVLRPSGRTLLDRLKFTLVAVLLAGAVEWSYRGIVNTRPEPMVNDAAHREEMAALEREMEPEFREILGDEEYDRIVAESEQKTADRRRQFEEKRSAIEGIAYTARMSLHGALAVLGLLPVIAVIWNRVSLRRTPRGELAIRSWYLWPRVKRWETDAFDGITVFVREKTFWARYGGMQRYFVWTAQLRMKGARTAPVAMDLAWSSEEMGPIFKLHQQRDDPGEGRAVPENVKTFIKALRALTGLPASKPQVVRIRTEGSGLLRRKRVASYTESRPVSSTTRTYTNLDEVPEHLRGSVEALMEGSNQGGGPAVHRSHRITVRDADGTERVYESLDEMPPHLREAIESARKSEEGNNT